MRVGELAKRSGLTVRALHYYEELGLLQTPRRTASGHREYDEHALGKLQQIQSLQAIGMSLAEVKDCLLKPQTTLRWVVELHLDKLRRRIAHETQLVQRLERLLDSPDPDAILQTLETMSMLDKYYSPEQMQYLAERREQLGDQAIREVEAEWPELIARMQRHCDQKTPVDNPEVQALGRRWKELVAMFTGGNPGIAASLQKMRDDQPQTELSVYVREVHEWDESS